MPGQYPDKMQAWADIASAKSRLEVTPEENYRMVLNLARWARRVGAGAEEVKRVYDFLGLDARAAKRMVRGHSEGDA